MTNAELVTAMTSAEDPLIRILGEVMSLQKAKNADYNAKVDRDMYWIFGDKSFVQMLWTKTLRLRSLVIAEQAPNHESLEDTAKDLIVYSLFFIEWLRRNRQ